MRMFIKKIKEKVTNRIQRAKTAVVNSLTSVRATLAGSAAEGYIDTGVKIIIGVVIGGVILAGLYTLFNTTIIPTLTSKIGEMFNYGG